MKTKEREEKADLSAPTFDNRASRQRQRHSRGACLATGSPKAESFFFIFSLVSLRTASTPPLHSRASLPSCPMPAAWRTPSTLLAASAFSRTTCRATPPRAAVRQKACVPRPTVSHNNPPSALTLSHPPSPPRRLRHQWPPADRQLGRVHGPVCLAALLRHLQEHGGPHQRPREPRQPRRRRRAADGPRKPADALHRRAQLLLG